MAYVYLKNKTFLNAHLLKKGLAEVDLTYNYKNKERFISYKNQG
jgi:site-specific DNA-methyltransferase (adenine-specific)